LKHTVLINVMNQTKSFFFVRGVLQPPLRSVQEGLRPCHPLSFRLRPYFVPLALRRAMAGQAPKQPLLCPNSRILCYLFRGTRVARYRSNIQYKNSKRRSPRALRWWRADEVPALSGEQMSHAVRTANFRHTLTALSPSLSAERSPVRGAGSQRSPFGAGVQGCWHKHPCNKNDLIS